MVDLLFGLIMKFYYLVGFGLEEFKVDELKFDEGKKKELSIE